MPLAKSFNIVLENSSAENEYVVLNGTDSTGVADSGDRVIWLDASQSEAKPSWLTEAADGSGDYAKENVIAFDGGWGFQPGSKSSGNDNANADPEIIAAIRGLRKIEKAWRWAADSCPWLSHIKHKSSARLEGIKTVSRSMRLVASEAGSETGREYFK